METLSFGKNILACTAQILERREFWGYTARGRCFIVGVRGQDNTNGELDSPSANAPSRERRRVFLDHRTDCHVAEGKMIVP